MLITHITGLSDVDLIAEGIFSLSKAENKMLERYIQERLSGRPIAKIIGQKEFYGRPFFVNDDVLDPRPDSELLIDILKNYAAGQTSSLEILDLGTGSGCLILTLLSEIPQATGMATDLSPNALTVAQKNAQSLGLSDRMAWIQSDWFDSVEGQFDIIVSNPPYIAHDVIPTLDKDVRNYDPILALDGGEEGLNPYQVILPQAKHYLKQGGIIALEHGYDQCGRIKRLIENAGFSDCQAYQDLGGHDRVLTAIHK